MFLARKRGTPRNGRRQTAKRGARRQAWPTQPTSVQREHPATSGGGFSDARLTRRFFLSWYPPPRPVGGFQGETKENKRPQNPPARKAQKISRQKWSRAAIAEICGPLAKESRVGPMAASRNERHHATSVLRSLAKNKNFPRCERKQIKCYSRKEMATEHPETFRDPESSLAPKRPEFPSQKVFSFSILKLFELQGPGGQG